MTDPDRQAVIRAVEQELRERFAASVPNDDDVTEWRSEAAGIADAALAALRPT